VSTIQPLAIGLVRRIGWAWIRHETRTRTLDPGCFALVMATGIANALLAEDQTGLSDALFTIDVFAYPWLCLLTLARGLGSGGALWADLLDPRCVFSFFTIVAGSDVFGIQLRLENMAASKSRVYSPLLSGWRSPTSASSCWRSSKLRSTWCMGAGC
jgi:Voltage-dependent anion channel